MASSLLERALSINDDLGPNQRKLRLFGCACCRLVWGHLTSEAKLAVDAAERFAVGEISEAELDNARTPVVEWLERTQPPDFDDEQRQNELAIYRFALSASEISATEDEGGWPYRQRVLEMPALMRHEYVPLGLDEAQVEAALCERLRDIFGNPFQSPNPTDD